MAEDVNTPQSDSLGLRAIGATAGVSAATVLRDLRKVRPDPGDGTVLVGWTMGIDGRVRPDRRFSTAERDAEIVQRRSEGETFRSIAAAMGCSVGTVHRVVKAAS